MTRLAEPSRELRHVVLVAGTLSEWNSFGASAWRERIAELGKVVEQAGASWLTIRPLDRIPPPHGGTPASISRVGNCVGIVDPQTDGRHRLVEALNVLRRDHRPITDANIGEVINAPASGDPDLAIIAGPDDQLPTTLVWELAYCELVYLDVTWAALRGDHLEAAIAEFAGRHRRFGGLD
ncbi:MAG TPA: undecaprenyl diphosphate synthase family protein [Ilumatobacteraceae bacterium]|nr:undecaprenyl diphosphate synthase family protein [Ilumatobacteraceae bacterium]